MENMLQNRFNRSDIWQNHEFLSQFLTLPVYYDCQAKVGYEFCKIFPLKSHKRFLQKLFQERLQTMVFQGMDAQSLKDAPENCLKPWQF